VKCDTSARCWSHEHPELCDFLLDLGAISAARAESLCFERKGFRIAYTRTKWQLCSLGPPTSDEN
jgi:hypothetical protein